MSDQDLPEDFGDSTDDGYTPGTSEIRAAWTAWYDGDSAERASWHVNEFDRWLTEHDRQVAAEAWNNCILVVQTAMNETPDGGTAVIYNPYEKD